MRTSSSTSPPRRTSTARSRNAGDFITTDVYGTFVLLEAARETSRLRRFVQISTDEVYGSVPEGSSKETDELRPRNPYSASKAGADRLAYSYWATYDVPVVITRASNNYGPNQFPEKIIPALHHEPDRRHPGAALWRRAERARLAARRRPLPRRRFADRPGPARARSTTSAAATGQERRSDPPDPRAGGQAGVADQARRRSARSRPPLLARHFESSSRSAGSRASRFDAGTGGDGQLVSATTSAGGDRSRTRIRPSAPITRTSTATPPDPRRGWSSAGHRRDGLRRRPPGRSAAGRARPRCRLGDTPAGVRLRRRPSRSRRVVER